MSWVELGGAGWRLKSAGCRWVELGGGSNELGAGGWSWVEVHGLVIPYYLPTSAL